MRLYEYMGYKKPSKDGEKEFDSKYTGRVEPQSAEPSMTVGKRESTDSKPSFKDAEDGIDVKDIFIVSKLSENSRFKIYAKIFLKEFKKIMEVEVL